MKQIDDMRCTTARSLGGDIRCYLLRLYATTASRSIHRGGHIKPGSTSVQQPSSVAGALGLVFSVPPFIKKSCLRNYILILENTKICGASFFFNSLLGCNGVLRPHRHHLERIFPVNDETPWNRHVISTLKLLTPSDETKGANPVKGRSGVSCPRPLTLFDCKKSSILVSKKENSDRYRSCGLHYLRSQL